MLKKNQNNNHIYLLTAAFCMCHPYRTHPYQDKSKPKTNSSRCLFSGPKHHWMPGVKGEGLMGSDGLGGGVIHKTLSVLKGYWDSVDRHALVLGRLFLSSQ